MCVNYVVNVARILSPRSRIALHACFIHADRQTTATGGALKKSAICFVLSLIFLFLISNKIVL